MCVYICVDIVSTYIYRKTQHFQKDLLFSRRGFCTTAALALLKGVHSTSAFTGLGDLKDFGLKALPQPELGSTLSSAWAVPG